jgi:DNA polymerase-1
VRSCFVPDPGHVFVEADLAGAEAWVTAALCADTDLLDKLRTPGFDVHKWTAAHIYAKPVDEITKTERFLGKVARHALNYGMQWKTFMGNVNADADRTGVSITAAEAKRICTAYHRLHPKLERWWRLVGSQVDQTGKLTTVFGRTRTFYGRRSADRWLDQTHREAIAFGPQSTVADLLNRGLLRWWHQHDGRLGTLLLQIHDAVLIQTTRPTAAGVALRRCLEEPITVNGLEITIPADVLTGTDWASLK